MKNTIIPLRGKNFKVLGFSDELIMLSSKRHSSFESFLASTEKAGMLETIKTIPVQAMKGIVYNEKEETFIINYDKKGKTKKEYVELKDLSSRETVVSEIATLKLLKKSVVDESKTQPLLLNLFFVLMIGLGTWVFRGMAVDALHGEHYVATGRRRGAGQLLANAAEAIGPTGTTMIGVLGLIYMIYKTYKRYTNPSSEVKYG